MGSIGGIFITLLPLTIIVRNTVCQISKLFFLRCDVSKSFVFKTIGQSHNYGQNITKVIQTHALHSVCEVVIYF